MKPRNALRGETRGLALRTRYVPWYSTHIYGAVGMAVTEWPSWLESVHGGGSRCLCTALLCALRFWRGCRLTVEQCLAMALA